MLCATRTGVRIRRRMFSRSHNADTNPNARYNETAPMARTETAQNAENEVERKCCRRFETMADARSSANEAKAQMGMDAVVARAM